MAKINTDHCDNVKDLERDKFRKDDVTGDKFVAVTDEEAQAILEQIRDNLGGTADTTPSIQNVSIVNANVEEEIILPANTKRFLIRSRNRGVLTLAYASGGNHVTIPAGSSFVDSSFYQSQSVFIQSSKNNDVVELVTYV